MMRVFDGLRDAAALVVNGVGETLRQTGQTQSLIVYTATPGSETHQKLELLAVIRPRRKLFARSAGCPLRVAGDSSAIASLGR